MFCYISIPISVVLTTLTNILIFLYAGYDKSVESLDPVCCIKSVLKEKAEDRVLGIVPNYPGWHTKQLAILLGEADVSNNFKTFCEELVSKLSAMLRQGVLV